MKDAYISHDGKYRYWLMRTWSSVATAGMNCVMLNPSTADATTDDATIRRLIGFVDRHGLGFIMVYNLFAYRATRPIELERVDDPVGPENDKWLASLRGPVLCAWGKHKWADREAHVVRILRKQGCELLCLGQTLAGHPKHPVRLPYADATWGLFE